MRVSRRGRRGQRGQALVIVALGAIALMGAASLAVDLSIQTHDQRNLQNVADAAALSGAEDLPATPLALDQYTGAQDALQMIRKKMGWNALVMGGGSVTNSAWASTLASACNPTTNTGSPPSCNITKTVCSNAVPPPSDLPATCDSSTSLGYNAHYYTITIQTPAKFSKAVTSRPLDPLNALRYFEVVISQDTQNYLSGVLNQGISTQGAHATAYHWAPNQTYGFALYAQTIVQTQNKSTLVVGDVYASRNVSPQSSGLAGFCAANGLVVLGAPQYGVPDNTQPSDGQSLILPMTARVINYNSSACSGGPAFTNSTAKGTVTQTRNPASGCSVGGVVFGSTYDSLVGACVANPPIQSPTLPIPTKTNPYDNRGCATPTSLTPASPGNYTYDITNVGCLTTGGEALVINNSGATLNPGVYVIQHNPSCVPTFCYDVDISANISLSGVTFWLEGGATLGVHGNSTHVSINPAPAVVNSSPSDGRVPIYAPPGSAAQVYVTDNGAYLQLYGTMYIPSGVAHTRSNAYYQIVGQALVGTWDDQGGDHPSADITYDSTRSVPLPEVLKLVE